MTQKTPSAGPVRTSLAALTLLASACGGSGAERPSDLLLLYTGTVNGYLEPCGCVAGQIGGIDRMSAYIQGALAEHEAALFVDAGDLFCEEEPDDEMILRQLPLKARTFFQTWGELGCEAVALGENELLIGVEALQELSAEFDVPILCGNLEDAKTGEPVFPGSRIVERGGRRIGIFSLLSASLDEPKAQEAERVKVGEWASDLGLRITPWRRAATVLVEELAQECDVIVALSHLGYDKNVELAQAFPRVDLVLGGHFDSSKQETNVVDETPVLVSFVRGSRVGRMEWWWPEEERYFLGPEDHGPLADASAFHGLEFTYDLEDFAWRDLLGRERALGSERWQKQRETKLFLRETARRELEQLGQGPQGNRFSHVLLPMHPGIERSEMALAHVDEYHDALQEYWSQTGEPSAARESAVYPSPESCASCHAEQVEFWRATKHSRALSALEATGQHVDPECFPCHTVGYRNPGGFRIPGRHRGFANVQCAACHGPGGSHVQGGLSYITEGLLAPDGGSNCATCHNKEHDPDFEKEAFRDLALVACPPTGDEPSEGLLQARIQGARILEAQSAPNWGRVAEAWTKAGDVERSLQAARLWLDSKPSNLKASMAVATRLLQLGRLEEAEPIFRRLRRRDPMNSRAWAGWAECVIESDPRQAEIAAKEALSLDQENPARIDLLARVYLATGRRSYAKELIDEFVTIFPHHRLTLAETIQRIE